MPPHFAGRAVFCGADRAAAERLGQPLLGRHRLRAPDPAAARLSASLHAVVVGPVTVAYLQVSAVTELEAAGTAPRFLVATPGDASPPVESGSASLDASRSTAAVLQPGRPRTLLLPAGSTMLLVGIEQAAVLVHLSRLLGRIPRHPLVFNPELDLMAGTASRWNLAVAMLHAELEERGSLLRAGIGQGHLGEFLMSALLYGHRSSYSEALAEPERVARHPATRAARDFIELHLSERLTVASVASAVGVSPRTLQAAFRTEMQTTPTDYIRGRRLDQARADAMLAQLDRVLASGVFPGHMPGRGPFGFPGFGHDEPNASPDVSAS